LSVPLAATALVVGASAAFGALNDNFSKPGAPVPGNGPVAFLTMRGATSGAFTGAVTEPRHHGAIEVLALDFGLSHPIAPSTGLAIGHSICAGVSFRKPTDRTTPRLFAAAATNEVITRAVFDEAGRGPGSANALTIELTNATVTSVHHVDATTTGRYEDVTLAPQKITFIWEPGGVTAEHDCHRASQ
jgi:type VI secretion system Hcp family effector